MRSASRVAWIAAFGLLGAGCADGGTTDSGPRPRDTGPADTGSIPLDVSIPMDTPGAMLDTPGAMTDTPVFTDTPAMLDAGTDAFTACTATQYRNAAGVCVALTACTATQYESTAATETTNRVCSDLTLCSATEYQTAAPTATTNRVCAALTVCTAAQFQSVAPTATVDRTCAPLTDCVVGQFVTTAATATTNRVCAPCAAGNFSTTPNAAACTAWAVCRTPGQFEMTAGSATANSVCTTCGAGTSNCDGVAANMCEVNTNTSNANCGRCGTVCGGAASCVMGSCAAPVVTGPTFVVPGLTAAGCRLVEHAGITGDDRGGIAVSGSRVFYNGDAQTGHFSRADLSGGTSLIAAAQYDGIFSDLTTEQVYALGNATRGSAPGSGGFVADRFFTINGTTGAAGAVTMLSEPITMTGGAGIFSGASRVVIVTNSRLYNVTLPSGAVQDLGPYTLPTSRPCESYAIWGVAEFTGGNLFIAYVANLTTISRAQVYPAGLTTTLATFTNLSDMCSFTVSPNAGRWYWHHEGGSQFGGSDESIGYCDLPSPPRFRVTTMSTARCTQSVDTQGGGAGDQRGVLAVTGTTVLYSGDTATVSTPLALGALTSAGRIHDAMISDLRSGQLYVFANAAGTEPVSGTSGPVTQLIAFNDTGTTAGAALALSAPITLSGFGVGFFSGYGRVVVYSGTAWFAVNTTTGLVTTLVGAAPMSPNGCESWAISGIAENFGGANSVLFASLAGIVRQNIATGAVATVAPFTGGDVCSISISTRTNRWFSQYEGAPSFVTPPGFGEFITSCAATWDQP